MIIVMIAMNIISIIAITNKMIDNMKNNTTGSAGNRGLRKPPGHALVLDTGAGCLALVRAPSERVEAYMI